MIWLLVVAVVQAFALVSAAIQLTQARKLSKMFSEQSMQAMAGERLADQELDHLYKRINEIANRFVPWHNALNPTDGLKMIEGELEDMNKVITKMTKERVKILTKKSAPAKKKVRRA